MSRNRFGADTGRRTMKRSVVSVAALIAFAGTAASCGDDDDNDVDVDVTVPDVSAPDVDVDVDEREDGG